MPDGMPVWDRRAIQLLLSVIETPAATITGVALDDYHGPNGAALKTSGLLTSHGHELATASGADHEDTPINLIWSADADGYGYFSPLAGWIRVPDEWLATFRIDFELFFKRVLAAIDWPSRTGPMYPPCTHVVRQAPT